MTYAEAPTSSNPLVIEERRILVHDTPDGSEITTKYLIAGSTTLFDEDELVELPEKVIAVLVSSARGTRDLRSRLGKLAGLVEFIQVPSQAVEEAIAKVKSADMVVLTGSLGMVQAVRLAVYIDPDKLRVFSPGVGRSPLVRVSEPYGDY